MTHTDYTPGRRLLWRQQMVAELLRLRIQQQPASLHVDFWKESASVRAALDATLNAQQVLDVGCGTGETAVWLAREGRVVTGYDFSRAALKIAHRHSAAEPANVRQRLAFVEGDGRQLPFADQSFDTVLLSHVLEQEEHPTPLLKEITRVLKSGGTLQVTSAPGLHDYDVTRLRFDTAATLTELLCVFFADVAVETDANGTLRARCRKENAWTFPRIIGMLNIQNEDRWIREALDSMARVCDGIVIYDDGSTDRTPEICAMHPAVIDYERREEATLDKTRDKNRLLQLALKHKPDWILCLDGDEVLENSAPERIFDALRACPPQAGALEFHFLYMWNDRQHVRTDGIYHPIYHPCLFRCDRQAPDTLAFQPTDHGGNLHCERVPQTLQGVWHKVDVEVIHLGYMYAEDRLRKYEWNKQKDPAHAAQGYYEHLVDQVGQTLVEWNERPYLSATIVKRDTARSAAVKQDFKPDYYYANARRNLVELVPKSSQRVLDVGCGHGMTGGLLRSERGIEVVGLEIHPETAEVARHHLTQVIVGDLEHMDLPFEPGHFDCMILGDVLEHLTNPWHALQKLARYLHPAGTFVISLPNVRNLAVLEKLMNGSWSYEEQGILDKTHMRFFAKQDMLALFEQAGIAVELAEIVRDPLFEKLELPPPDTVLDIDVGSLRLQKVSGRDLEELTAQQFIFTGQLKTASKRAEALPPVREPDVSIIIPVFNNLHYTRQCITSLMTTVDDTAAEIIVVDNGSTDGTADYLRQIADAVRTVSLPQNLGFAKGCNAGARSARGRYLVFLNNDTLVQPRWLRELVDCIERDPAIGVVGNLQIFPETNKVQQAGIVCGAGKQVFSIYNNDLSADHPAVNKPREFQFLAGSCLLIEAELFLQVGEFDEGYLNSCEDVDLCMKVRAAGRKVFYCPQSRIYHFESKSVSGHPKDSGNYRRFLERWSDVMVRDDERYLREDGFLPPAEPHPEHVEGDEMTQTTASATPLQPPRTALLTTFNQRCGLAGYAHNLVQALRAQGCEPLVLAEDTAERTAADEVYVIRCWTRDEQGGAQVLSLLAEHKIAVLHVNHGGMFEPNGWLRTVMAAARQAGIRVVTTFHSTESIAPEFAEWSRLSDHVFVHHDQNRLELIALGAPGERLEQIPLGMPPVTLTDLVDLRLEMGLDPHRKTVSTFGFIEPHKGVLELIDALAVVNEHMDVTLDVIGTPHPHNAQAIAYFEQCKRRAAELELAERVQFTEGYGSDAEVFRRLQASDAIVMNYQHRRFESSAATATALATGRPVIAAAVPTFELSAPVIFKITEQFSLPMAIMLVLHNPFLRKTLLQNVLTYERTARWDVIAQRIIAVYNRVATEPPQADTNLMQSYETHPDDIYTDPLQRERIRWLRAKAEGRILEIGPATGYLAQYVGAAAAVDINCKRLAVCSALRPGIAFEYGDVVKGLPYADKEFDQVMAPEIFEHVDFEDAVLALKECLRVGRRVLVTLPNADKPDYDPDLVHNIEHRWLVVRQNVDRLLREAGAVHYDIDVSQAQDFYLLDIRSDQPQPRARIHERAALLPTLMIDPGEPLSIGIDASALEDPTAATRGIGRYALSQFSEMMTLRPEWTFTVFGAHQKPASENVRALTAAANGGYACWTEFYDREPDVLYYTHPMGHMGIDLLSTIAPQSAMTACTFYDLVPLLFAQAYMGDDAEARQRYTTHLALAKQRCELFFCISQCTAQDLQVHLQMPQGRLRIIHAGVDAQFAQPPADALRRALAQRLHLTEREFLLFVGYPDQRKNLWGLLNSLAAARRTLNRDVQLVIAGGIPPEQMTQLHTFAGQCSLPQNALVITGHVNEAELSALYHSALALLYPSHYEGFGFPIVEAMAAGLPVIAGNNSSQAEIAGNAALLVNTRDLNDISAAIVRLASDNDLYAQLQARGRAQARRFTWHKVAEKTAIYLSESVARRNARRKTAARTRTISEPA